MLDSVMRKLFGTKQDRDLRALRPILEQINALVPKYKSMSDAELQSQTQIFRDKLSKGGATVNDILPEAFSVVREASHRVLNMRHFDPQILGGLVLHQGKISEMKTGEGKTLTATLPSISMHSLEKVLTLSRSMTTSRNVTPTRWVNFIHG